MESRIKIRIRIEGREKEKGKDSAAFLELVFGCCLD